MSRLTDEELAEIEKRDHATRNHPPKVRLSYEERLINRLPETDLYIRNTKATRDLDCIAQGQRLYEQLKPIFEPAYAAERDRARLIAELRSLRAIAEALAAVFPNMNGPVYFVEHIFQAGQSPGYRCALCKAFIKSTDGDDLKLVHADSCPWRQARQWVAQDGEK